MASQVKVVAVGLAVAPELPTKILRLAAGEVMLSSWLAALQVLPLMESVPLAAVMGSATTSPLQLLVSNLAEYIVVLLDGLT